MNFFSSLFQQIAIPHFREVPPHLKPKHWTKAELSRHDDHNLELRTGLELKGQQFSSRTEVYLIVPPSFRLGSWTLGELQNDFRARLRLSLPKKIIEGNGAVTIALDSLLQLSRELISQKACLDTLDSGSLERLRDASQLLGAVLSESMRKLGDLHSRQLTFAHAITFHSGLGAEAILEVKRAVTQVSDTIKELREQLEAHEIHTFPFIGLLEEYASFLYVRYLAALRREYDKTQLHPSRLSEPTFLQARTALIQMLDELQVAEARYRVALQDRLGLDAGDGNELLRLSQLKKFFQSKMFIEVERHVGNHKISESAAAVGAACAALWAAAAQYWGTNGVAQQSSYLLAFGVVAYVLKDRMKEWGRKIMHKKVGRHLPDFEETLTVDNRKIGVSKEWIRVRRSECLPEFAKLRRRENLEIALEEDVLFLKKVQAASAVETFAPLKSTEGIWAIQENIRINLERYLKHMDDPYKELPFLDEQGQLKMRKSKRVYHFYLAVRFGIQNDEQQLLEPVETLYRVVVDKGGIRGVSAL